MYVLNKSLVVAMTAVVGALFGVDQGLSCSCKAPPPPKDALAASAAVFSAKVMKIEDEEGTMMRKVTLKVDKWWKGGEAATVTVLTHKSGATCGYGFQPDTGYLVYAYQPKDAKVLHVSLCSRTRTSAQAEQSGDLKELGEGKAPAK